MLVFDKKSLRCLVPPTEDCDVPSTTPQPPEEDEDKPREQQARPSQNRQTASRPQVQASQLRASASEFQQNAASSFVAPQYYAQQQPQQLQYNEDQQYRDGGNRQL